MHMLQRSDRPYYARTICGLRRFLLGIKPPEETEMGKTKTMFAIAAISTLCIGFGSLDVSAQGRGGGHGGGMGAGIGASTGAGVGGGAAAPAVPGGLTGLDRADQVAGARGAQGRAIARTQGANKPGFCPPGQRKKAGLGSRFKC
jgi:hypothetical protein